MSIEALQIVAVAAIVLSLVALAAAILSMRAARGPGAVSAQKMQSELVGLRTDVENIRDRNRLLEERFERYERSHAELRDAHDRMREDVEARLARVQSHDTGQKALQEQIYEIRKEHQVLMERGDRHDRRVSELHEEVSAIRGEMMNLRSDGVRSRA